VTTSNQPRIKWGGLILSLTTAAVLVACVAFIVALFGAATVLESQAEALHAASAILTQAGPLPLTKTTLPTGKAYVLPAHVTLVEPRGDSTSPIDELQFYVASPAPARLLCVQIPISSTQPPPRVVPCPVSPTSASWYAVP
jgi:hypothetical protein